MIYKNKSKFYLLIPVFAVTLVINLTSLFYLNLPNRCEKWLLIRFIIHITINFYAYLPLCFNKDDNTYKSEAQIKYLVPETVDHGHNMITRRGWLL